LITCCAVVAWVSWRTAWHSAVCVVEMRIASDCEKDKKLDTVARRSSAAAMYVRDL
jgi:hypothetical protein